MARKVEVYFRRNMSLLVGNLHRVFCLTPCDSKQNVNCLYRGLMKRTRRISVSEPSGVIFHMDVSVLIGILLHHVRCLKLNDGIDMNYQFGVFDRGLCSLLLRKLPWIGNQDIYTLLGGFLHFCDFLITGCGLDFVVPDKDVYFPADITWCSCCR